MSLSQREAARIVGAWALERLGPEPAWDESLSDGDRAKLGEAYRRLVKHLQVPEGSYRGGPSHGTLRKYNEGCRCDRCRPKAQTKRSRQQARANSATLATATNHYKQWTGPELEIAARTDLTHREVAVMLGRSLLGVKGMRMKLRNDPRYRDTAGEVTGPPRILGT